ncbi:uncharacterized protein LOC126373614 [Pectinophora gossypiella]|uniref:uncharacterized protein LOC126373614 n=1 Tax=Pectinophora gossypiella TaxID=13191 RepID=UPI00214F0265|nr:uncharacterized protein LOC126373614 [Pectinophora gossypiella]
MGRKVLLAVVCWLTLCEALGEAEKTVNSSVVKDNESAESAPGPKLYQNIQLGPTRVYASGAPYAAYSYQVPTVLAAPLAAGSQLAPVSAGLLRNLKDSYGKLAEGPQTTPYRTAFPQQYVQLQDLPPHLAQPLVSAAAPSFQFKTAPNYFFGPHSYKVPSLQLSAAPTSVTRFSGHGQPLVYAENIKSFAPSSNLHSSLHKFYTTPQHSNGNNAHYSNAPTFQRLQEKPATRAVTSFSGSGKDSKQQAAASHDAKGQIQAAPAQTSITTVVNGKQTVVNIETDPPVPLLDLNLLEPLTFDNPLVPQLQHFLPKVNSATYHKLPTFNANEGKNKPREFVVTKTKSYDSSYVKNKPQNDAPKKKQHKPQSKPVKPTIVVNGNPNGEEFSYEIDTPNHKETYNEQVIKYNKETNMKPVEYSYNEKTHKEPEVYTYVHSSKEPLKVTHVEYNSDDDKPKHLVYTVSPEEQDEEQREEVRRPPAQESEDSGESSAESDDEGPAPLIHHEGSPRHSHSGEHHDSPKHKEHKEHKGYSDAPRHSVQHSSYGGSTSPKSYHHSEHHSEAPRHSSTPHYEGNSHSHTEGPSRPVQHSYNHHESSTGHPQQHSYDHHKSPQSYPQQHHYNQHESAQGHPQHHEGPQTPHHMSYHVHHDSPRHEERHHHGHQGQHYEQPRQSHYLKAEHRGQEYKQRPNQEIRLEVIHTTPQAIRDSPQYSQPLTISSFQPITPEYEEDIRILPTHKPHADIKVDPNQHTKLGPAVPQQHSFNSHPSPAPQKAPQQPPQEEHPATLHPHPYNPQQHVFEKSKRVIIKENEETPEEMHMRMEQVVAEMVDREENNEEDFEKAYKESAFGFPAYEQGEEAEKDIYDPESYGAPQYHKEYKIESSPFQQYQREGDEFPKFARLTYKDARDDKQEDYFLDYSVHKPESVADLHKSKLNYYKMFKKNKPDDRWLYPEGGGKRKEKTSEKIILAPSFDFFTTASKPKAKQSRLFAQYKAAPIKYEYDYSKGAPRDSTAFASRPHHKYSKTHFVEPQFQYGFEPLSAPIVIDSELAAMASNDSPESEKPGTRKKVYKENWYIKKTSTTGNKPS